MSRRNYVLRSPVLGLGLVNIKQLKSLLRDDVGRGILLSGLAEDIDVYDRLSSDRQQRYKKHFRDCIPLVAVYAIIMLIVSYGCYINDKPSWFYYCGLLSICYWAAVIVSKLNDKS